ncbi:MAG: hypothetical protein KGL39_41135 [Patescibacteria group bacterium]|nr:hypothetical protein [Patescibacteria group bacterium]
MKNKMAILASIFLLTFVSADASSRKTTEKIEIVYQGTPANYQIYIFGGDSLRCRGENLHVSRDERGDGDGPIIVECR